MCSASRYAAAFDRWIAAIHGYGELRAVELAVHPAIEVERYGFGPERGRCVEVIRGTEGVRRWIALTKDICKFELVWTRDPDAPGTEALARYRITAEDFVGGGEWRATLHDDGRIRHLVHVPDDLDPKWAMPS